uniref:Uncharacterized protein n=1 Tax=Oryza glumipatula TaxID=40148 RepID=A0A0E0BA95_9ORYZ
MGTAGVARVAGCWIRALEAPAPSAAATPQGGGAASTSTSTSTTARLRPSAAYTSTCHRSEGREVSLPAAVKGATPTSRRSVATAGRFTNASTDGNATNRFMVVELDAPKQRVCIVVCLSSLSLPPLSDPGADNPPSTNATESLSERQCAPQYDAANLANSSAHAASPVPAFDGNGI